MYGADERGRVSVLLKSPLGEWGYPGEGEERGGGGVGDAEVGIGEERDEGGGEVGQVEAREERGDGGAAERARVGEPGFEERGVIGAGGDDGDELVEDPRGGGQRRGLDGGVDERGEGVGPALGAGASEEGVPDDGALIGAGVGPRGHQGPGGGARAEPR